MRYVAAYMLAAIGGRHGVSKIDIENILGAVGIDCDNEQAAAVVQKMSGKTIDELIANGSRYLAVVSSSIFLKFYIFTFHISAMLHFICLVQIRYGKRKLDILKIENCSSCFLISYFLPHSLSIFSSIIPFNIYIYSHLKFLF